MWQELDVQVTLNFGIISVVVGINVAGINVIGHRLLRTASLQIANGFSMKNWVIMKLVNLLQFTINLWSDLMMCQKLDVQVTLNFGIISVVVGINVAGINVIGHHLLRTASLQKANGYSIMILVIIKLFKNRGLTHPDEYCEKHNLEAAQIHN